MANKNLGIFILIATVVAQATWVQAAEHIVGDCKGWGPGVDYEAWVKDKEFKVGDTLVFNYSPVQRAVFYTTKDRYDGCCPRGAIMDLPATGKNVVSLGGPGEYYFVSYMNFCLEGCKLHITVKP